MDSVLQNGPVRDSDPLRPTPHGYAGSRALGLADLGRPFGAFRSGRPCLGRDRVGIRAIQQEVEQDAITHRSHFVPDRQEVFLHFLDRELLALDARDVKVAVVAPRIPPVAALVQDAYLEREDQFLRVPAAFFGQSGKGVRSVVSPPRYDPVGRAWCARGSREVVHAP